MINRLNLPPKLSKVATPKRSTSPSQMQTGGRPNPDWDEPLTDQELEAIEAAFQTATSSPIRKRDFPVSDANGEGLPLNRRRLPFSILQPDSYALMPCSTGRPKMKYPAMEFVGQIVYSRSFYEVERAARNLLKTLGSKKMETGQATIGLDIEWRPTFKRGVPPGKTAVMQLCIDSSHCHVMHVIHSGIPESLRFLLEDSTLLKVGVGIANDSVKVFKDYSVSIKGLEDLSFVANQKLGGEPKNWSLSSLTEMLISKELMKPKKIRLGNWERSYLSKEQLQYAATDAFTCWYLYQVLQSLTSAVDTADNISEELKSVPES